MKSWNPAARVRPDRQAWIRGGEARCAPEAQARPRPWRMVLLGAPGVGKGTQAELIAERLGACPLSTGDVIRALALLDASQRTRAQSQALDHMRRGELAPDATVLALIRERARCLHCPAGFLLDGFPRTLSQAEALDELLREERLALDAVLAYELPIERLRERLKGRRSCASCGTVYHVEARPPLHPDRCDHCGRVVTARDDDHAEAVRVRMQLYERETAPLRAYYAGKRLLRAIDADASPSEVHQRTLRALALA